MKRLYVWETAMIIISDMFYFGSLWFGLTERCAIIVTIVAVVVALVPAMLLGLESISAVLIALSALGLSITMVLSISIVPMIIVSVLLIAGAVLLSSIYIIDEEIDYWEVFRTFLIEFLIIFFVTKYGHALWNS